MRRCSGAVAGAVLVLLSGCSSAPSGGGSPIATPNLEPTNPPCSSNIRVIPGEVEGAAGHRFLVLAFNNVGDTACEMSGYPKVELVDDAGKVVLHVPETLRGQAGLPEGTDEPESVTLLPGKSASAIVEASAIPEGDGRECASYSLMVTPPDQKSAVPAGPAQMPNCDVQVHPVVAGDQRNR
jgi:hypothetical protein